ncbi:SUMF1/EgtB/PvdO family nonheme iron enzyme [Akkermansiaceae bacterium]|nr:SUMF1/EgtB/PvdO family nonheme iron enzyme [Akkermansiaceae bacterium]
MKTMCLFRATLCLAVSSMSAVANTESQYQGMMEKLRTELTAKIPKSTDAAGVEKLLSSDELDGKLVTYVVLHEATPKGLAEFAKQGRAQEMLVNSLLNEPDLMREMLVADGAKAPQQGRGFGPAQYGQAAKILADIHQASEKASSGVLRRLALAVSLEHADPIKQRNPEAQENGPEFVDPVKRYLHYEKALADGELDPAFDQLTTWDLRMVVDGEEPNETLVWGREMLRNYRPNHIYNENYGWRYVGLVTSDVKYGSGDVKYDRPELQFYQNILMNGGVCGRRAFIGRFILRAFGIPTTARPSRGHAALAHWTPKGWVINLGGGWGGGWTKGLYNKDRNFLATTQARVNPESFLKVKRAQWVGDLFGEKRIYGRDQGESGFWNTLALDTQDKIIKESKAETLDALGEELGEADKPTAAEKIMASEITDEDTKIAVNSDGSVLIPAAAYSKPKGNTRDVSAMKSFGGGLQVFLPRFFPKGTTIVRGGTWKGDATACSSGSRMLSGGYGKYDNWGFRAAMTPPGNKTPKEITLDLGDGVKMEMVYIRPGKFTMGGERTTDGRFECVEVPKHPVELTKGFYLGKYEVTQDQYLAITGLAPSKSSKGDDFPVDNIGVDDAKSFCEKAAQKVGYEVRLPTEAEWEYASRGGRDTKWFFGDDAASLGDYAWFEDNAGGKSHPVGKKKPNQFGLYDVYGNVNERVADTYDKKYYAKGPKVDPTGPSQGTTSKMEYEVRVPRAGKYELTADVVTANYDQNIKVAVNDAEEGTALGLPFTEGSWKTSQPITVELKTGRNVIRLYRDFPPQYGVAVKSFKLTPVR